MEVEEQTISSPGTQPQECLDEKNENKEDINSNDVDRIATTPNALSEGRETRGILDNLIGNSVENSDSINQSMGNETVNVTLNYEEKNKGTIDQEKEKCEPLDSNDNKDVTQDTRAATAESANDSFIQQKEGIQETSVVKLVQKEPSANDSTVQQREGTQETSDINLVKKEPIVNGEVGSECNPGNVVHEQPEEKIEEKKDLLKEEDSGPLQSEGRAKVDVATEAATTETQASAQSVDNETPAEGETENENAASKITNLDDSSANKEVEPTGVSSEIQKKEESVTKPEAVNDDEEAISEEKRPDIEDQQKEGEKPETLKQDEEIPNVPGGGSGPRTTWYHPGDGEENANEGSEGYSTSVVGGVVMRTPLSSISNEPKKGTNPTSTGSKFKVAWGSLFKRKKSTKDKPDIGQQSVAVEKNQVDDGTDGVQVSQSVDSGIKESNIPMDNVEMTKDGSLRTVEPEVVLEKPLQNEDEKKDISEGAIVPLEEGVVENDEKSETVKDDMSPQDRHQDETTDPEIPVDEDSLLRERIAKRESTSPPYSPTKRMQMRMSYAEGNKEVEVIGTREVSSQPKQNKQTSKDNRLSCRELGEVDHEGWLTKRGGGTIFASWKRKWVVLKEQRLYYYKTAFDPEAGGVVRIENCSISPAPEMKKKFCFKIEAEDPKANKLYVFADSQEDMDKWVTVLSSASRGEVIVRKTQNQEPDDIKMRKKTNSFGRRADSVLGLGGYYDYNGELDKTDQKRRASFGSSPKETQKTIQPVDKLEIRSESPKEEDAKPNDIQKLLTIQSPKDEDDAVSSEQQAPVVMETASTVNTSPSSPSQEESFFREIISTVDTEVVCEEGPGTKKMEPELKTTSTESPKEEDQPEIAHLEQVDGVTKETMATHDISQSDNIESPEDARVATPTEHRQKPPQTALPTNTTWYYVLDDKHDDWIDLEDKKRSKRNSDELLSLVCTIKDARISITGTPLPGNDERAQAMSSVSKQNSQVLKLREMKRTLKDKERDLMAMEELFSKELNRQSLHEWKSRYSYLTTEETIDENENIDENSETINGSTDGYKGNDGGEVQDGGKTGDGNLENDIGDFGGDVQGGGEVRVSGQVEGDGDLVKDKFNDKDKNVVVEMSIASSNRDESIKNPGEEDEAENPVRENPQNEVTPAEQNNFEIIDESTKDEETKDGEAKEEDGRLGEKSVSDNQEERSDQQDEEDCQDTHL